jgi:hypothetical protein
MKRPQTFSVSHFFLNKKVRDFDREKEGRKKWRKIESESGARELF